MYAILSSIQKFSLSMTKSEKANYMSFGDTLINGVVNTGLGLIAGGITGSANAKRQERAEQRRMYESMLIGQMNAAYNQKLSKEMWDYTNYENQRKHIEAAGLNPALLYGQGGGGGASAAGAGVASSATLEPKSEMIGLQAKLINSQVAANLAQTNKTNAEAEKISGVDTELTKSQTELNNALEDLKVEEITTQKYLAKKVFGEAMKAVTEGEIAQETKQQKIDEINKSLKLLDEKINLTKEEKNKLEKEVSTFEQMLNNETTKANALAEQVRILAKQYQLAADKWAIEQGYKETEILQNWVFGIGNISTDLLKAIITLKKSPKTAKEIIDVLDKMGK